MPFDPAPRRWVTAANGEARRPRHHRTAPTRWRAFALATSLVAVLPAATPAARADEAAILAALRTAFTSPERIAALTATLEADPAWDPSRLGGWLHQAAPYTAVGSGPLQLVVDVGFGQRREVALRLPANYDPRRPSPLLYALHPSGGNGPGFIAWIERHFKREVDDFVIAAPSFYRQTGLDAPPPFTHDHAAILAAVRQHLHIDTERVVALGYSLGGYATWAVALWHREELAAAVPLAATLTVPPDHPHGLWRDFVPNLGDLPVLTVWGAADRLAVRSLEARRELGGIAELNRRLRSWLAGEPWAITWREQPERGHGEVLVDGRDLATALAHRRRPWQRTLSHTFRHRHQGAAGWLEVGSWQGEAWGEVTPPIAAGRGESLAEAEARVIRPLLGQLRAEVSVTAPPATSAAAVDSAPHAAGERHPQGLDDRAAGGAATAPPTDPNRDSPGGSHGAAVTIPGAAHGDPPRVTIAVTTRHVGALDLWLGEDLVPWGANLTVELDGRVAWRGTARRDLATALAEAVRRRDFTRLRWARIHLTTAP